MLRKIRSLLKGKRGQGMTEYLLIAALIAIACMGVYQKFGKSLITKNGQIISMIEGVDTSGGEYTPAKTTKTQDDSKDTKRTN